MCDYEKKSHRKGKEKNRTKDKTKYMYTQKHVRATLQNNERISGNKRGDKDMTKGHL